MSNNYDMIRGAGYPIHGCDLGEDGVNLVYNRKFVDKIDSIFNNGNTFLLANTLDFGHDRVLGTQLAILPWAVGDIIQLCLVPTEHNITGFTTRTSRAHADFAGLRVSLQGYWVDTTSGLWTLDTATTAELTGLTLYGDALQSAKSVMLPTVNDVYPFDVPANKNYGLAIRVDALPTDPNWIHKCAGRHELPDSHKRIRTPKFSFGIMGNNLVPRKDAY